MPYSRYRRQNAYSSRRRKTLTLGTFKNWIDKSPVPPTRFAELTYSDVVTLAVPNTGLFGSEFTWALNGLYDSLTTVGGHQPYGFDQYCPALYQRYKVYNVTVKIECYDPANDGDVVGAAIIPPNTTYTITGKTSNDIAEAPFSCSKVINDSGSQKAFMYAKFPMSVLFGSTREQFTSDLDNSTGSSTGNPGNTPVLHVAALNDRLIVSSILCRVTLSFWTMFYERTPLARS